MWIKVFYNRPCKIRERKLLKTLLCPFLNTLSKMWAMNMS